MAEKDSIRDNMDAYEIAVERIEEARAIATILAIATSPDSVGFPARELISRALDGITALLDQAHEAAGSMKFGNEQGAAENVALRAV